MLGKPRIFSLFLNSFNVRSSMFYFAHLCSGFVFEQLQNLGRRFGLVKYIYPPPSYGSLGCCSFKGGGSVVVDSFFIVAFIVFCVFCPCFIKQYLVSFL